MNDEAMKKSHEPVVANDPLLPEAECMVADAVGTDALAATAAMTTMRTRGRFTIRPITAPLRWTRLFCEVYQSIKSFYNAEHGSVRSRVAAARLRSGTPGTPGS